MAVEVTARTVGTRGGRRHALKTKNSMHRFVRRCVRHVDEQTLIAFHTFLGLPGQGFARRARHDRVRCRPDGSAAAFGKINLPQSLQYEASLVERQHGFEIQTVAGSKFLPSLHVAADDGKGAVVDRSTTDKDVRKSEHEPLQLRPFLHRAVARCGYDPLPDQRLDGRECAVTFMFPVFCRPEPFLEIFKFVLKAVKSCIVNFDERSCNFFFVEEFAAGTIFSDVGVSAVTLAAFFQFMAFPAEVRTPVGKTFFAQGVVHRHAMAVMCMGVMRTAKNVLSFVWILHDCVRVSYLMVRRATWKCKARESLMQ